ncbi:hypothetical protein BT63DRAFT_427944, partial [Microthyrium microscopicum]
MAGIIRDPAFWRRFSVAVHQDEEQGVRPGAGSPLHPQLKHSDSWLDAQKRKRTRHAWICWLFWLCFFGLIVGVVLIVLWMRTKAANDQKASSSR